MRLSVRYPSEGLCRQSETPQAGPHEPPLSNFPGITTLATAKHDTNLWNSYQSTESINTIVDSNSDIKIDPVYKVDQRSDC